MHGWIALYIVNGIICKSVSARVIKSSLNSKIV